MRFSNQSQKKQNQYLDELTGIYNQQGFYDCTEKLLADSPDTSFCLIYWNIRKFRTTNDLFGWEAGDKILIHWANTLREILRDECSVYARLDHDNFICCVTEDFLKREDWTKLGEICYNAGATEYHFYSCCGLYRITDRTLPLSNMIDKARAAMETIKNNYMTLYAWYDESMWNTLLEEQRMNFEFKKAIEERQFKVYYQPICRSSDGLITSAEALIRWQHPVKGMISPGSFIPLFEKNGFISILDRYVWNEVCAMQQSRLDQGLATVPVSVNVSRVEFYNPTLCDDIRNIARSHNVSPDLIKIEITESAYADNPVQVMDAVKKLHSYGFSVLMDDFGSGYSSLNMLKDLPIDVLKIDMRFLDDIRNIAKKHNISPDLLKIEITESAYADNPVQVMEAVKKLHAYGFSVLMDDFGSGYSSLNMLKDLPIDVLKIDMRFLDDLDKDQKAAIMLESIIRLAKWMKLSVVSEGVETQKEWEYLRSVECDAVQGYFFYKPMPQEDFIKLLDKSAAHSTNLLFHAWPEDDDSILNIFNHNNTLESILFYSMLGGMGLLEVCEDNIELLQVNKGYYEALYGTAKHEHKTLNIPFEEPERSLFLEQCRISKEDSTVQQFQLHHKLEDGSFVWLSVKLRYFGGNSHRSRFLIAVDNINEQKRLEHERYVTNYNSVLLKLYDRVYHLDYSADTIELLHASGDDFIRPQTQYPFASFFQKLAEVTDSFDLKKLEIIRNKSLLDETLEKEHTNCLIIHYDVNTNGTSVATIAHFFKADLPDSGVQYICCVKKTV